MAKEIHREKRTPQRLEGRRRRRRTLGEKSEQDVPSRGYMQGLLWGPAAPVTQLVMGDARMQARVFCPGIRS